jgi:8-oxo-dGTP pyrophosphatase MutT (NUDIX family)
VILVRGDASALEAYWVMRGDAVGYMPGFRAFVGGNLHRDDAVLPVEGAPEGPERTMRACALREVFEETGVLLGVDDPGPAERVARARERLLARGKSSFRRLRASTAGDSVQTCSSLRAAG